MKIYLVGGCVRDYILGRTPKDYDFLVVGATEKEFLQQFPTAERVGSSFPVFLVDGNEYAFARKERKAGKGHKGFVCDFGPEVTLVEDLQRRDLTINAVAMDNETGAIFMAPGAYEDFEAKVLRHVSPAFAEDPLRVYRVARFAAELPDFTVCPTTLRLMTQLRGELPALPAERVWKETEKALKAAPRRFFETLAKAGVLDVHFPEMASLLGVPAGSKGHEGERDAFEHSMNVLEKVSIISGSPVTRWAAACHDLGKGTTPASEWPKHIDHDKRGSDLAKALSLRLRAPKRFAQAASKAAEAHMKGHRLPEMRPGKAVKFVHELDSRFPGGLEEFFKLLQADGTPGHVIDVLLAKAKKALRVKLPAELRGLGRRSGERLLQLRAEVWKEAA